VFEPLWNRQYVRRVEIVWQEDIGVGERGGYFDQYGIIRDVMQNHLLQVLALVAMERPASRAAEHIRDQKVQVLRCVKPPAPDDVVTGQYAGYTKERHVAPDSITPTFAAAVLHLDTPRWKGVPFHVTAGKGLAGRLSEVRIVFRDIPADIFGGNTAGPIANRLVMRIQPDEAIRLRIVNKQPGLNMALAESELNLKYDSAFAVEIPDAYECLLLDVLHGEKSLFIRSDELAAAWDVFTPVLNEMERRGIKPEPYEMGSSGPARTAGLFEENGQAHQGLPV
jgi:glucose-6-phosphate 1-dehydrogenase